MRKATRSMVPGLWLVVLCAGCDSQRSDADFIPATASARQALDAALKAWQGGQSPGEVKDDARRINLSDSRWRDGYRLESYAIVKEEEGEGAPWFAVRMTLKPPPQGKAVPADQTVRYIVYGIDPLWISREEDYNRDMGLGNSDTVKKSSGTAKKGNTQKGKQ
jgi:hypothetical protein